MKIDSVVLTNIVLGVAFLGIVANLVGSGFSGFLLWRDWRLTRELRAHGFDAYRQRLAHEMFMDELLRFWFQFGSLLLRTPSFLIDPERYSAILNDLWQLTLVSSLVGLSFALGFMWRSLEKARLRRYVLRTAPPEPLTEPL